MRPYMWTSFTTGLTSPSTSGLLTPSEKQKACSRHVRFLTLEWSHESSASSYSQLLHVLPLLRDNQLRAFTSAPDNPLHARLLLELLCRQAELTCLRARLDWTAAAGAIEDAASWTTELTHVLPLALRRLTTLRVYTGDPHMPVAHAQALYEYEAAYNNLLVASAPHLHCLEICGWRWHEMPRSEKVQLRGPFEHAMGTRQALQTLRQLVMADLELSGVGDILVQALSLDTLSLLKIEYCDQVGPFLHALASGLRQQSRTSLQVLTVRTNPWQNGCAQGGFEALLQSFDGLVELECSFPLAVYVDWKASLCRHPGLRKLLISSFAMSMGILSWPGSIPETLAQCPRLYYFAFKPLRPRLGVVLDCPLPTELPFGLDESLDAVATAPALRTLRLLWVPGIEEDELNRQDDVWIERAAQIAYSLATLVLMYLFRRGSLVRLLALSGESRWKQTRCNSNRHFYPHYYYRLEETEAGVHVVTVRDCIAEYPELAVFS